MPLISVKVAVGFKSAGLLQIDVGPEAPFGVGPLATFVGGPFGGPFRPPPGCPFCGMVPLPTVPGGVTPWAANTSSKQGDSGKQVTHWAAALHGSAGGPHFDPSKN